MCFFLWFCAPFALLLRFLQPHHNPSAGTIVKAAERILYHRRRTIVVYVVYAFAQAKVPNGVYTTPVSGHFCFENGNTKLLQVCRNEIGRIELMVKADSSYACGLHEGNSTHWSHYKM